MKKLLLWAAAALVLLSSCGEKAAEPASQAIEIASQTGTIAFEPGNRSAGTITLESGSYTFSYGMDGSLTVTYPDGYVYTQTQVNGGYAISSGYDAAERRAKGYPDGLTLAWGIEGAMDRGGSRGGSAAPLLGVFLLGLGAWNLFAPRSSWWLSWGWRFRGAEPSDLALGLYRLGGGVLAAAGVLCLIASL